MRLAFLAVALVTILLLVGCIPSIHPIYTEEDLIFVPELLGTWSEDDCEETWAFSAHDPKVYELVHTDEDGKQGRFVAHLVKLDDTLFLDLFPAEPVLETSDFYKVHLILAHTFILVEQIEPRLKMSTMSLKWLEEYLEQNPKALQHEQVEEGLVLTASTQDLQSFLIEHLGTEGAFDDPTDMRRRTAVE